MADLSYNQSAQVVSLVDETSGFAAGVTAAGGVKVDGSGTALPVSGTVAATQSGTWTVQPGNTANTTAWLVTGTGGTFPVTGTVTANAGTNLNTSALALDASLTAPQHTTDAAGDTYVAGTSKGMLSLVRVASAAPTLTAGQFSAPLLGTSGGLIVSGLSGTGVAPSMPPISVSGVDGGGLKRAFLTDTAGRIEAYISAAVTTAAPVYTTGTTQPLSIDTSGNLRVTPNSSGAQSPGSIGAGETTNKRAYNTIVQVTLSSLNTEQNMLLFRNPILSGKTVYMRNITFTSLTSGKSCVMTVYQNPTLSAVANAATSCTFQDAGDTVTLTAHGRVNTDVVLFATIVTTTGISINTEYYVINATANTFQVSATLAGSALPLTTNGSGTIFNTGPSTSPISMYVGGGAMSARSKTTSAPWTGTLTSASGATTPAGSRGTKVSVAGDTNEQSSIDYDWGLIIAPGNSLLISGTASANNSDFVANLIWSET